MRGRDDGRRPERVAAETIEGRLVKGLSESCPDYLLSNPLLLGFEEIERLIDRAGKGGSEGVSAL